jgi:hypothetical protein
MNIKTIAMYDIPVLFLIFKRPETTERVFERIRQIKPSRLYIAADAPRAGQPDEIEQCRRARAVVETVDWECEVKTRYREQNLGCRRAVTEAISWFFEQEEYGVIFEDDCLPDLTFFPFCRELLLRYKDDDRIGMIGGNNFSYNKVKNTIRGGVNIVPDGLSYDFCSVSHIWGWATWRRVWKNYEADFPYWAEAKKDYNKRKSLFRCLREEIYFSSFLSDTLLGERKINTWDVQLWFTLRIQNQLAIYPSVNLVTNIGLISPDATHKTSSSKIKKNYIPSSPVSFPLKHPRYVLANYRIDQFAFHRNFFSYKRLLRYFLNDY